ncbi:hypothetical protein [Micromonospora sp. KC606]|nr:hypothetical protein [Micromonospora sp. KC606]
MPSLAVLHRILAVGGFHLAVVVPSGRVLQPRVAKYRNVPPPPRSPRSYG